MDVVNRKLLKVLIELANADRIFSDVEKQRIIAIARSKSLPLDEVHQLIEHPEPIGSVGELSSNQKFDCLYRCVDMMLTDGIVLASEINFCKIVAHSLGFKQGVIDFLQNEIQKQNKKALCKEALKKELFEQFTY